MWLLLLYQILVTSSSSGMYRSVRKGTGTGTGNLGASHTVFGRDLVLAVAAGGQLRPWLL